MEGSDRRASYAPKMSQNHLPKFFIIFFRFYLNLSWFCSLNEWPNQESSSHARYKPQLISSYTYLVLLLSLFTSNLTSCCHICACCTLYADFIMRYMANQRARRPISIWECNSAGDMLINLVKEKQLRWGQVLEEERDEGCLLPLGNRELWMLSGEKMDKVLYKILLKD